MSQRTFVACSAGDTSDGIMSRAALYLFDALARPAHATCKLRHGKHMRGSTSASMLHVRHLQKQLLCASDAQPNCVRGVLMLFSFCCHGEKKALPELADANTQHALYAPKTQGARLLRQHETSNLTWWRLKASA